MEQNPLDKNPLIAPYNHFEGYNKSIEGFKNHPEMVEFDRACYEALATKAGEKLIELIDKKYLLRSLVSRTDPNYPVACMQEVSFKSAFIMLKDCVESHKQRIKQVKEDVNGG